MLGGRTTVGGHQGGLPLGDLLRVIQKTAYRQHHVAFGRVARTNKRLPPDVATVMLGRPEDATYWNLKVGVVPDKDIRQAGGIVDDEEVLELMDKYGMNPLTRKTLGQGLSGRSDGLQLITEKSFKRRLPSKLIYKSWRTILRSMLISHVIRGSADAERLLGTRDYREIMRHRRLRETVHYDQL